MAANRRGLSVSQTPPLFGGGGARGVVHAILTEWTKGRCYATDLIERHCRDAGVTGKDRAMVNDLVLSTLRHLSLTDYWIDQLAEGKKLEVGVRWLLRAGLCEILIRHGADHAVVNETAALAGRATSLVNAVLRRACREKTSLLQEWGTLPGAIRFSHPDFLLQRWTNAFGADLAEALAAWNQQPAEVYVRRNELHPDAPVGMAGVEGLTAVGGNFFQCAEVPRKALENGWCYAQDISTALAPQLMDPQPGERVLDACAAPGGKTAILAERMGNRGELVACDLAGSRLQRLKENLKRMRVNCAEVVAVDWLGTDALPFQAASFDRVLLDVPCSNSGVMRRRVDVRWRLREQEFDRLMADQRVLLDRCAGLVRTGGRLVYSTCSIDPEENEGAVGRFLQRQPGWRLEAAKTWMPPHDLKDGAHASLLIRTGELGS